MKIGSIDLDQRPLLIAEIGNNHEGNAEVALKLADAAMEAGAGAVKVQIIDPVRLVNRSEEQRIAQLTRYRLPREVFLEMAEAYPRQRRPVHGLGVRLRLRSRNGRPISTPSRSLRVISISIRCLQVAARSGKPIVLSTGMSTLDEIARVGRRCRQESAGGH